MEPSGSTRHSCLKLELANESIFIKGTWFDTHFNLSITDGLNSWICTASESEVRQRAEQWDQPVAEYVALAERYLGFQQPGSRYGFEDIGNDQRRLSWTFEKQAGILDFLMDANIRLSEEVVRKTQAFDKLKEQAERCLSQSEKFNNEKAEFESAVYAKFVDVLNSKKAKLRELRDQTSKVAGKAPVVEEEASTDKTVSYDEDSGEEKIKEEIVEDITDASKEVASSSSSGRRGRGRRGRNLLSDKK